MRNVILLTTILVCTHALGQDAKPKRTFGLTFSFPYVNNYRYYNYYEASYFSKFGFTGIGAGLFVSSGKNRASFERGVTGDSPMPFGPFDIWRKGVWVVIGSRITTLLYHRNIYKGFAAIAGPNQVQYRYSLQSTIDTIPSFSVREVRYGCTVGMEYLFKKYFLLAVFYHRTLSGTLPDRSVLSMDFRFNAPLHK